jgi:hypothetical protein
MEGKTMNDYNLLNYSFTAWPTIDQYNERTDNKQPQETVSGDRVIPPYLNLSVLSRPPRKIHSKDSNVNGKDIFANNVLYNYLESINNNPFKMFASKIPDEKPIAKEQPVVWDRYLTIPGKKIEPKQEDGSNSPLEKNVLFDNYLFPDNPFNPYPTLFQYKQPIHPPMSEEQSKVMADIADNPKLVFTPEYTKWRQYIMQNSPKYLERLWKRLTAKEQDYVYENNYSAFTALSNEAKGKYGESRMRRKNNEVAPRVLKPLAAAFAAPFAIEGAILGLPAAEQQIGRGFGYAIDKFAETEFGQTVLPTLTKFAESKVGRIAGTAANTGFGAYGAAHLASEDGIRKTVGHVLDGNLGDAAWSATGDLFDATALNYFGRNATKGIVDGIKNHKTSAQTKHPFKSELDWTPEGWLGKRVDGVYDANDITSLQSHIPEYHKIEQTAKSDGTWLKMPDGSTWQGDPRSWVQMQSKDYDIYTGNSPFKYQVFSHSSDNKFQTFDLTHFGKTDDGFFGKGFYSHPAENINGKLMGRNSYGVNNYLLTTNVQKPFDLNNPKRDYMFLFNRDNAPNGLFDGYDSAFFGIPGSNSVGASPAELVVPKPSNYKSLIGNNGDFNPSNNNMYKAFIPLPLLFGYGTMSEY